MTFVNKHNSWPLSRSAYACMQLEFQILRDAVFTGEKPLRDAACGQGLVKLKTGNVPPNSIIFDTLTENRTTRVERE